MLKHHEPSHVTLRLLPGMVSLLLVWLVSGPAYADGAGAMAPSSAEPFHYMFFVYAGAIVMALCGGVFWWYRRASKPFIDVEDSLLLVAPELSRQELKEHNLTALGHEKKKGTSSGRLVMQVAANKPLFATSDENQTKECPECHRKFPSWMVVCPVDAQRLETIKQVKKVPSTRGGQTLDRQRCPRCEKRYESEASFCPIDGQKLIQDTVEDATRAPDVYVCRSCGRFGGSSASCSCTDDGDWFRFDPADFQSKKPTVPLMMCPRCRTYGALGQTHCKHDGELLVPVVQQILALPATGYGPRQKICPQCGTQHSASHVFCCFDGTRLITFN